MRARRRPTTWPDVDQQTVDAMHLRLIELQAQRRAGHPSAWMWGEVLVEGEAYPLDAGVCDILDRIPWPRGWHIIRRPRNRQGPLTG